MQIFSVFYLQTRLSLYVPIEGINSKTKNCTLNIRIQAAICVSSSLQRNGLDSCIHYDAPFSVTALANSTREVVHLALTYTYHYSTTNLVTFVFCLGLVTSF